jgi:superfamily I DNA and RNA helicase
MEYLPNNLEIENNPIEINIWDKIVDLIKNSQGIMGYKTPSLGEKELDIVPTFILRGPKIGILLLHVIDEKIIGFDDDNEFWQTKKGEYSYSKDLSLTAFAEELKSRLKKSKDLFDVRNNDWKFKLEVRQFLIFANNSTDEIRKLTQETEPLLNQYITIDNFNKKLKEILFISETIEKKYIDIIDSLLDGSDVFKKSKKKKIPEEPKTINDFIKKSLDHTFKLDHTQRQIALQIPPGPQRIRGLAGTGKTIILCMKAALALKSPEKFKILFAFNTQSMYNQVKQAITEYYFYETKSMPDWNNIDVLHAWGGAGKDGVYYKTAIACGIKPLNFMNVRNQENPLEAIFADLLTQARGKITPIYDIALIDEAQDFSNSFFETIYHLTKPDKHDPKVKKIIWAYDEFQSLTDLKIKEPESLFGTNESGTPNMPNSVLDGMYKGDIKKDFVLPNSYRNPRINLMVAHGLALGVYSQHGKIPMENKIDWEARGYKIHSPKKEKFVEGDNIKVERLEEHSKNNLEQLLKIAGKDEKRLIQFSQSNNPKDQLDNVIQKIEWLITKQEVEPEEIVVINLDNKNSKNEFSYIRQQLDILGIKSIMPGYIEGTDAFKEKGYVTLTTTFRSKGNEANIVFIINSQKVISDSTFRMRNAILLQ